MTFKVFIKNNQQPSFRLGQSQGDPEPMIRLGSDRKDRGQGRPKGRGKRKGGEKRNGRRNRFRKSNNRGK